MFQTSYIRQSDQFSPQPELSRNRAIIKTGRLFAREKETFGKFWSHAKRR
jgi:hypothetical protein